MKTYKIDYIYKNNDGNDIQDKYEVSALSAYEAFKLFDKYCIDNNHKWIVKRELKEVNN